MPTSLGPAEILVILVVALIVLGPKRLPEAGRQIGRALAEVRRWSQDVQNEIRDVIDTDASPGTPTTTTTPTTTAPTTPAATPSAAAGEPGATAGPPVTPSAAAGEPGATAGPPVTPGDRQPGGSPAGPSPS